MPQGLVDLAVQSIYTSEPVTWSRHEKINIASLKCCYNSSLIIVNINFSLSEVSLSLKGAFANEITCFCYFVSRELDVRAHSQN